MVVIPFESFDPPILSALLEDIITRDGTDYGAVELSLDKKKDQLMHHLRQGDAFIGFDSITESCMIISADQANEVGLLDHAE